MIRQEISANLREFRDKSGIKLRELCYAMETNEREIYRLEKSENNYAVEKAIRYADAVGAKILIKDNKSECKLSNNSDCAKYIKSLRKEKSAGQTAKELGISDTGLLKAENEKTLISIDLLLKLATYYGFEVRVEPK